MFFKQEDKSNLFLTRTDFSPLNGSDYLVFAKEFSEHLKKHRLFPDEIREWDDYINQNKTLPENFKSKLIYSFSEGILRDDLSSIDDDAFKGTCGQLIFFWIRENYFSNEIIWRSPQKLTSSSKEQGVDYFEILCDPSNPDNLSFVVWEVKATDGQISSRTPEIYDMLKNRAPKLLRGLQMQLSLDFPEDKNPVIGKFAQSLLDDWIKDAPSKKVGGAVVFGGNNIPSNVFTTFHNHFPNLASEKSRLVILVNIPDFVEMRKELWKIIQSQMS